MSVSSPTPDPYSRADWDRVAAVYGQCIASARDEPGYLPPILAGFLAEVTARVSASYYDAEDDFVEDFLHVVVDREEMGGGETNVRALYRDARLHRLQAYSPTQPPGARRRPCPVEAVVETARRLRDLNTIEHTLRSAVMGAILGGSVSYGRFYNVMGATDGKSSDIDMLLVLENWESLPALAAAAEALPGANLSDIERLQTRASTFSAEIAPGLPRVVFSAKVDLWQNVSDRITEPFDVDGRYALSMHVVTRDVFGDLILERAPRIATETLGESQLIHDFRESQPARQDHQRSFGGENLRLDLHTDVAGSSFLRESHIYVIDDEESYHPGMFQNLILPQFDCRWGPTGFRRAVEAFRWKMVERLRYERKVRPHEFLRLSLAHTRSEVFAPHTVRSVDGSTMLS
jgi:hypothetical protein